VLERDKKKQSDSKYIILQPNSQKPVLCDVLIGKSMEKMSVLFFTKENAQ
jgi:hypothetical protein